MAFSPSRASHQRLAVLDKAITMPTHGESFENRDIEEPPGVIGAARVANCKET